MMPVVSQRIAYMNVGLLEVCTRSENHSRRGLDCEFRKERPFPVGRIRGKYLWHEE